MHIHGTILGHVEILGYVPRRPCGAAALAVRPRPVQKRPKISAQFPALGASENTQQEAHSARVGGVKWHILQAHTKSTATVDQN